MIEWLWLTLSLLGFLGIFALVLFKFCWIYFTTPGSGPYTIAKVAFAWTLVSITVFGICAAEFRENGVVSDHSFFSGGWKSGLRIFDIPINTWFKYFLVIIYQVIRAVFGSLLANFTVPKLRQFQNQHHLQEKGQEKTSSFTCSEIGWTRFILDFWSAWFSVSDTVFALSQIDFIVVVFACNAFVNWRALKSQYDHHEQQKSTGHLDVLDAQNVRQSGMRRVARVRL